MSTPRPHSATDLALAPVLIGIERNLARLRGAADLEYAFALELGDDGSWYRGAADRARRVQNYATRGVDLHGWAVRPSTDRHGLVVSHGEYEVSIMLGEQLAEYVGFGLRPAQTPAT